MTSPTSKISDEFLADLYRSSPAEARIQSLKLSASDRARLAMFCNAKAHLRAHGRMIAGACTEASLLEVGGPAGAMLLRQINLDPDTWGGTVRADNRKVSLGELRSFERWVALN